MRFFKRKPVAHHAAVFRVPRVTRPSSLRLEYGIRDALPLPGDDEELEPYFVAVCNCNWMGETRATSAEAFQDAREHTPNVDDDLKRPAA